MYLFREREGKSKLLMFKKIKKYGLIGYPLSHSFSPGYFARKFEEEGILNTRYELYPLEEIDHFRDITNIDGLNVTIPYKEQIIPYLDELSVEAQAIGAVNTIQFKDGHSKGYNTDIYGFKESLVPLLQHRGECRALVLGTGGAAKAVWYVLDRLQISYLKVSRASGDICYSDIDGQLVKKNQLIINCTPLGMAPKIDECPDLPYNSISTEHILYDLIYNPDKTLFLTKGAAHGALIKNGHEMLQLQAEKSWQIWNSL